MSKIAVPAGKQGGDSGFCGYCGSLMKKGKSIWQIKGGLMGGLTVTRYCSKRCAELSIGKAGSSSSSDKSVASSLISSVSKGVSEQRKIKSEQESKDKELDAIKEKEEAEKLSMELENLNEFNIIEANLSELVSFMDKVITQSFKYLRTIKDA